MKQTNIRRQRFSSAAEFYIVGVYRCLFLKERNGNSAGTRLGADFLRKQMIALVGARAFPNIWISPFLTDRTGLMFSTVLGR